jgi:DNA-directed RNA polymerase specialized sigma24 family protein
MRWNLDENPDLSPDLEWMLQSGQASRALLAEALAEEFYPSIYNLALIFLGEEKAARTAALQTFRAALRNFDRYRPVFGVKTWFYQQAAKSCQRAGLKTRGVRRLRKIAKPVYPIFREENSSPRESDDPLLEAIRVLPGQLRMAVLLRCLIGLEEREIAWVLGLAEGQVRASLEIAWQKLPAGLGSATRLREISWFYPGGWQPAGRLARSPRSSAGSCLLRWPGGRTANVGWPPWGTCSGLDWRSWLPPGWPWGAVRQRPPHK